MLYRKPKYELRQLKQHSDVETSGYIPQHIRIQNLMDAGKRLIQSRNQQYDYPDGQYDENAPIPDITRQPNYDLADAYQDSVRINDSIDLKKRAEIARIAAEKSAINMSSNDDKTLIKE